MRVIIILSFTIILLYNYNKDNSVFVNTAEMCIDCIYEDYKNLESSGFCSSTLYGDGCPCSLLEDMYQNSVNLTERELHLYKFAKTVKGLTKHLKN